MLFVVTPSPGCLFFFFTAPFLSQSVKSEMVVSGSTLATLQGQLRSHPARGSTTESLAVNQQEQQQQHHLARIFAFSMQTGPRGATFIAQRPRSSRHSSPASWDSSVATPSFLRAF